MSVIKAQCANPNQMTVRVEIELPLPEWEEILKRISGGDAAYYGPLIDIRDAVHAAIARIKAAAEGAQI